MLCPDDPEKIEDGRPGPCPYEVPMSGPELDSRCKVRRSIQVTLNTALS